MEFTGVHAHKEGGILSNYILEKNFKKYTSVYVHKHISCFVVDFLIYLHIYHISSFVVNFLIYLYSYHICIQDYTVPPRTRGGGKICTRCPGSNFRRTGKGGE